MSEKVAILGGGVGAVAAAFALTEGENAGRYDVTLYQIGWRLGGKGASGRNVGEHAASRRIEEHGLHVWFGFYYNALAMMERCYEAARELPDTAAGDTFTNAFTDHDFVVLEDRDHGAWSHFPIHFPRGAPERHPTPLQYAIAILRWLHDQLGMVARAPEPVLAPLTRILRTVEDLALHVPFGDVFAPVIHLFDEVAAGAIAYLDGLGELDDTARRLLMSMDIGLAIVRGMVRDGVITHGFDAIENRDMWEWLEEHGAAPKNRDCVFVRTFYSQAFAFPEGDTDARRIAAGSTLRAVLRMLFAYDGAFMRKMNAGMGDIVFAPFYRVLRERGVRFKFFHRVRQLHLSDDGKRIARISLGRQVDVNPGAPPAGGPPSCCPDQPEYRPLIPVADARVGLRHCWPSEPDWGQIAPAQVTGIRALEAAGRWVNLESHWSAWGPEHEHTCTLEAGTHFDHVVLGISLGALPIICNELVARAARWARMVRHVKTVRTQAFQLWLSEDLAGLGWTLDGPVSTAYVEPMDTWAEMNHILPAEPWPAATRPRLIAYFCCVLPHTEADPAWFADEDFVRRQREKAYETMQDFLGRHIGYLWPRAIGPAGFHWPFLVDQSGGAGEQRLRRQFWIANVEPSERYVLTVPGSTALRLPSDASGFENLFLAGDWTRNALNLGCVEAAVTSGMAAARGLSGTRLTIVGEID